VAYVQDFLDVGVGFDAAVAELLDADHGWLELLAEQGIQHGHDLRLRLAPKDGAIPLPSKRVRVDLERPYRRGEDWLLPFHWTATAMPALFPAMEAELAVAPLGADDVRLTFSGQYRPPLGGIGEAIDTAVLHRVVEHSVRTFLRALGDALQRAAAGSAGPVSSA
jgi:hypothetical protein